MIVPKPYNIIAGLALVAFAIFLVIFSQGMLTPLVIPLSVFGYQLAGGKV